MSHLLEGELGTFRQRWRVIWAGDGRTEPLALNTLQAELLGTTSFKSPYMDSHEWISICFIDNGILMFT